jgi:DeoR/GlpR family transcriptional regulator of sugar metabolism
VAGLDTTEYIRGLYADKLVFSAGGMTEDGVYEFDQQFAWVKKAMLERSSQAILMLDSSKVGRKVMSRVCGIDDIDVLVTDREPEAKLLSRITQLDTKLVVA